MIRSGRCKQAHVFPQPKLRILQIHHVEEFQHFETGILELLTHYQSVLLDDFCEPDPTLLVSNTHTYLPWLWLLVEESTEPQKTKKVYGLACLSDVIPGRHAFVHGVSHPYIRRHPAIHTLGNLVLDIAFNELSVRKVKAEIEANNSGAKGYCRRMGFIREACFKQDNRIAGQWQDVLIYSLFAEQFFSRKNSE